MNITFTYLSKPYCYITLLTAVLAASAPATPVPATDPGIEVRGTKYAQPRNAGLRFQRHREDVLQLPRKELGINPDKARNGSGIVLAFQTDSDSIRANFRILSANYMGSAFGLFEDGKLAKEFKFNPKTSEAKLEFERRGSGCFEIALPSFANVEFLGLELDGQLKKPSPPNAPVYVALGDSISHGVGQHGATHTTWPFLLSRKLNAELFNLAVGGGKVSVPIGNMLEDWKRIDYITILVGYNDLHFDQKTPEGFATQYGELLDAIRANHPDTPVYCISLLHTKKPTSEKTGHTANEFRTALSKLVGTRAQTDAHLHFVAGETITSAKNLQADNPKDPVHLGEEGAAMLADELYRIITRK
ncbi:hypothetical protein PDESU_03079 [Pontiella desulfatans]|uniref:SGNH hydrolase-type esterase domain-containing protein n=1 Tax=Pontiella desulfatans TaxID=2750659 RepID=A0A6C2U3V2_PONDE|nr:SGNH/GDSL hydrolase family protein [Pontiella desulfatans]VGO14517.1 hypothetical protein PDESU_03079 [Pontiella desulfatans]